MLMLRADYLGERMMMAREHPLRQAVEVMGVSHIRVRQLLEQVIRKASRGANKFKSVA